MPVPDQSLTQHLASIHLEELSFLLADFQIDIQGLTHPWPEAFETEDRLDAHLDGLEFCGPLGFDHAVEGLASSDDDTISASAFALASIAAFETGLQALIKAFTAAKDEQLSAYVTALRYGRHPRLADALLPLLDHERPIIRAATAEILGYRREGDAKRLWPLLRHADEIVSGTAVIALVRLGDRSALLALEQAVLDIKPAPQPDWLLPLLLLGSRRALQELTQSCSQSGTATPASLTFLAMAGGREASVILTRAIQYPDMKAHAYAALGIFGDINGVPHLLDSLKSGENADRLAAAEALQLITGAGLTETVTLEEPDEPDLTAEDITGEPKSAPAEAPPPPHTREVQRVCTQLEPWQRWWQEHSKCFNTAPRWRHGMTFTLGLCIDDLAGPNSTAQTRQHAHIELLIRSGQSIPFESDGFIAKQLQSINAWRAWWQSAQAAFAYTPWTFDGR